MIVSTRAGLESNTTRAWVSTEFKDMHMRIILLGGLGDGVNVLACLQLEYYGAKMLKHQTGTLRSGKVGGWCMNRERLW